eukprot:4301080-Karenia_brevis.AAC.1
MSISRRHFGSLLVFALRSETGVETSTAQMLPTRADSAPQGIALSDFAELECLSYSAAIGRGQ